MVYELSLDYAGVARLHRRWDTRIGVYVDGVLVQQYASTSPMTYLDWQNLVRLVGDGVRTTSSRSRPTRLKFNPNGRGAMIDDIRLTGTPGVVAGNAASGTLTSVALTPFVSRPAGRRRRQRDADAHLLRPAERRGDRDRRQPGRLHGLRREPSPSPAPSWRRRSCSSALGDRPLQRGRDRHRDEGANGSTASATNTLELDVLPKFESSDLGGDGLTNRIGTTGDETLNATTAPTT